MNVGEATQINFARLSSDVIESNAQVILEVAKAIGARLELSDLLATLTATAFECGRKQSDGNRECPVLLPVKRLSGGGELQKR